MNENTFFRNTSKSNKKIPPLKGFTLLELIIVVVILGIMVGLSLPAYQKSVEKTRMTEAVTVLKAIYDAQMRYALQNYAYVKNPMDIVDEIGGSYTGKYFDFFFSYPYPTLPSDDNEKLAAAHRNTDKNYFGTNYWIYINETGKIWSPLSSVNAVLSQ